jgi:hypothetical protein
MSSEWGTPPSVLLSITDPYKAWCLNEAIHHFGTEIEAAISKAKGRNEKARAANAENILRQHLGLAKKFRDPMDIRRGRDKAKPEDRPEPSFRME